MDDPSELRSSTSIGWQWVSRITTVSLEMVLPGVGGYFLDQYFGSLPWLTAGGFLLGVVLGMWHLVAIAMSAEASESKTRNRNSTSEPDQEKQNIS